MLWSGNILFTSRDEHDRLDALDYVLITSPQ
jgi:hypothetical protein